MTYPKPGQIILTDPKTDDVIRQTFEHIDAHEHYVSCIMFDGEPSMQNVQERVKYPWHRVVAVQHEFEEKNDGGRGYVDPTGDTDE